MIISASRRTDIPAFYAEWFMNRIRAGYSLVPNPFNRAQISHVPLDPAHVDVIVFWTRNPRPLFPYLTELDDKGYRYYFLYTLMANPREIDPGSPPLEIAVRTFQELAHRVGPRRIVWRYDPIFLTTATDRDFHVKSYQRIANALKGCTARSVVSVAHLYRKTHGRIGDLAKQGVELLPGDEQVLTSLAHSLAETASDCAIKIRSCACDLRRYGIEPGKCVDDELILEAFGMDLGVGKDTSQREECGCVSSKDIGMYDSCPSGCVYCYAVTSFERSRANFRMHNPGSASLLG